MKLRYIYARSHAGQARLWPACKHNNCYYYECIILEVSTYIGVNEMLRCFDTVIKATCFVRLSPALHD